MWGWTSIRLKGQAWFENMLHYGSEICLVLALFLTAYASLQKGPLKIKLQPPPKPFFSTPNLIQDYYVGNLLIPFSDLVQTDVSLVFYYAPWDLQCQEFRSELIKVAKLLEKQVTFLAINCWYSEGECRQHFAKLRAFPLIVAYVRGSQSLQYRGPLSAPYLAAFLCNVLKPLSVVDSYQNLIEYQARHEAVILGYFDSSKPWKLYNAFFAAALKTLERDPFCSIRYAVVTHRQAANQCGIKDHQDVHLLLWNQTLVYPRTVGGLQSDKLLSWLAHRVQSPLSWMNLPLAKSRLLYDTFTSGPTLVYFMPREILTKDISLYLQVKEIALRYRNCEQSERLSRLIRQVKLERIAIQKQHDALRQSCKRWQQLEQRKLAQVSFEDVRWIYSSKNVSGFASNSDVCPWLVKPINEACASRYIEDERAEPSVNGSRFARDEKVERMLRWQREFDCAKASLVQRTLSASMDDTERNSDLDGLYCRTNRSLNILALDSVEHAEIGRRLGLKLSSNSVMGTVIVDTQADSQHVIEGQISSGDLEAMILNFTFATSSRHLRIEERVETLPQEANVVVEELNGRDVSRVVFHPNLDVVVMLYSRHCTLCASVSRTFLHVAHDLHILNQVPVTNSSNSCNVVPVLHELKFVRMDAERNELPWHLTVESYPTILFFPAGSKANSRVFPERLPITRTNLLHFITSQMSLWSRFKVLEESSRMTAKNSTRRLFQMLLQRGAEIKKEKKIFKARFAELARNLNGYSVQRTFFDDLLLPSYHEDQNYITLSSISVKSSISTHLGTNATSLSSQHRDPWSIWTREMRVLRSQLEANAGALARIRTLKCLALESNPVAPSSRLPPDEL